MAARPRERELGAIHSSGADSGTAAEDGATTEDGDSLVIAGTYRLFGRIGAGGMGVVYEAEHVRLAKRFAVKLLRADAKQDARRLKTFWREARLVAAVESDHVVSIVDCGQLPDGTPFLVTELLRGQDLRRRLDGGVVLQVPEAAQIAIEACRGLSDVHAAGIVHRDLKPENLFLVERSEGRPRCKILDFGVAKPGGQVTTEHGRVIGTVTYMAPEQVLDASRVGPAADVFSVGAILFECLAGQAAHQGSTPHAIMFNKVHGPVPELRKLRPDLPDALCETVSRALSPDLRVRFSSAAALADALAVFVDHPSDEPAAVVHRSATGERPSDQATARKGSLSATASHRRPIGALGLGLGLGLGALAGSSLVALATFPRPEGPRPVRVASSGPAVGFSASASASNLCAWSAGSVHNERLPPSAPAMQQDEPSSVRPPGHGATAAPASEKSGRQVSRRITGKHTLEETPIDTESPYVRGAR